MLTMLLLAPTQAPWFVELGATGDGFGAGGCANDAIAVHMTQNQTPMTMPNEMEKSPESVIISGSGQVLHESRCDAHRRLLKLR